MKHAIGYRVAFVLLVAVFAQAVGEAWVSAQPKAEAQSQLEVLYEVNLPDPAIRNEG